MRAFVLFLLLTFTYPLAAHCDAQFQISCNNVHNIGIRNANDQWIVTISLLHEGHKELERTTTLHAGEFITLKTNNTELMRSFVPLPIRSGEIELTASSEKNARALANSICAKVLRPVTDCTSNRNYAKIIPEDQSTSVASPVFPVCCDTVKNITIFGVAWDNVWRKHFRDGFFYNLQLEMTKDAGIELLRVQSRAKPVDFMFNNTVLPKKHVQLAAQGQKIVSTRPFLDYIGIQAARISKKTLKDAVNAAVAVCPGQVPFAASPLYTREGEGFNLECGNIESLTTCESTGFKTLSVKLTQQASNAFLAQSKKYVGKSITLRANKENMGSGPVVVPVASGRMDLDTLSEEHAEILGKKICASKFKRTRLPTYREIMNGPRVVEHPEKIKSPTFSISCEHVETIDIWVIQDTLWNEQSLDGNLYQVIVGINEDTGHKLMALLAEAEPTQFVIHGITIPKKHVQLVAHGKKIISHTPLRDLFKKDTAWITFRSPEDALCAAKAICAEKAPTEVPTAN